MSETTENTEAPEGEEKEAVLGCDFQGRIFGATYEDGCCVKGYLWDMDSVDEEGYMSSGGDTPCPKCNRAGWLENYREDFVDEGYGAASDRKPRVYQHSKLLLEQEGEEELVRGWWEGGYDLALVDLGDDAGEERGGIAE